MKYLLILFALCAASAFAADVAGTWKGSMETPNGTLENTFVFKTDGDKLTGTVSTGQFGEAAISEGKVDGDNLAFSVVRDFNGNQIKLTYKGKMKGDEMTVTIAIPGRDQTFDFTLKKAS
jgi:hypothetical protein